MTGKRFPDEEYSKLESAARLKITPPDKIVDLLDLKGDEAIADLGCGTGLFTLKLALVTAGNVYGIDISAALLECVREKRNRNNITYIESPIEDIPENINGELNASLVFMSMVFYEIEREYIFKSIKHITATSFKLAVVEWKKHADPQGLPLKTEFSPGI